MKVTKYEHACMVVEAKGQKLVIDPGSFTQTLTDFDQVVAIVITHDHMDHLEASWVDKIITGSPKAQIFTTAEAAEKLPGKAVQVIRAGESVEAGPFHLSFFGGKHALIHASIPQATNIGVLVDKSFYYPGDSFDAPNIHVKALALPVSGPWLKIGEAMNFLQTVHPEIAFPAHDSLNSPQSKSFHDNYLANLSKSLSVRYEPLEVGQSLEL